MDKLIENVFEQLKNLKKSVQDTDRSDLEYMQMIEGFGETIGYMISNISTSSTNPVDLLNFLNRVVFELKGVLNNIRMDQNYDYNYLVIVALTNFSIYAQVQSKIQVDNTSTAMVLAEILSGIPEVPSSIREKLIGNIDSKQNMVRLNYYRKFLESSGDIYYAALKNISEFDESTYIKWVNKMNEYYDFLLERVEIYNPLHMLNQNVISLEAYVSELGNQSALYMNPVGLIRLISSACESGELDKFNLSERIGRDFSSFHRFIETSLTRIDAVLNEYKRLHMEKTIEEIDETTKNG